MNIPKTTLEPSSLAGPALAARGDAVLLGWVGPEDRKLNFAQTSDGRTLFDDVALNETSPRALGLTAFRGKYVVAWVGGERQLINVMQSDDGVNWDSKVTLEESSPSEPALAVFKDELYLAWRGLADDRIHLLRSADGKAWRDRRTLPERTSEGPALAALGDQLMVAWVEARVGLDLFIRGADGKVRHKSREGSGWLPAGDAWETLNLAIEGPVEAVASGVDCIDLFVRGKDNHLWHKRRDGAKWLPGGVDGEWNDLAGKINTAPTALSWGPDDLDIFVPGADDKAWHKRYDASPLLMGGAGWEALGTEATKNRICAVSTGLDRFLLVFSHANGYVYHSWWDGTKWSTSWAWLGLPSGSYINQPVQVVPTDPGRFILLCRRTDGAVYAKEWRGPAGGWDPGAEGWHHIGWKMTEPPTGVAWGTLPKVGAWGSRYVDLFARGDDGAVWHKRHVGDNWVPAGIDWESLGGAVQGTISAVSSGPDSYDLFIRGGDNAVWHKRWDGTQWLPSAAGWDRIGGETTDPPTALGRLSNGRLCVLHSTDGAEFKRKTFLPGTTRSRPWLLADASNAWIAWQKPEDQTIHLLSSADGITWKATEAGEAETCHDGPALALSNGHLVRSWTGAESEHRLNISAPGASAPATSPATATKPQPAAAVATTGAPAAAAATATKPQPAAAVATTGAPAAATATATKPLPEAAVAAPAAPHATTTAPQPESSGGVAAPKPQPAAAASNPQTASAAAVSPSPLPHGAAAGLNPQPSAVATVTPSIQPSGAAMSASHPQTSDAAAAASTQPSVAPGKAPPEPKPRPVVDTVGRVTFSSGKPLPRTTGLDDFAYYSALFKDRTGKGDPPFRRGRIWS